MKPNGETIITIMACELCARWRSGYEVWQYECVGDYCYLYGAIWIVRLYLSQQKQADEDNGPAQNDRIEQSVDR